MSTELPTIPGFRLLRPLGKGGMAVVYLAIQESLDREVALKLLKLSEDSADRSLRRFLHEAKTLARLSHRNVVGVYDVRTSPPMMVMEYLAGGTLADRMQSGLSLGEVVSFISQVALGLSFAHRADVVHRDVKPPNIMFREPHVAVITDFGIAKERSQAHSFTETGQVVGTTAYMSPEQLGSGDEVDGRSDQYSLGVVLYELLAGRRPFVGSSFLDVAMKHMTKLPDPLSGAVAVFDPVVQRMLAKAPAQRFPDCAAMVDALRALVRTHPQLDVPLGLQSTDPTAEQLRQLGFGSTSMPVTLRPRASMAPAAYGRPAALDEAETGIADRSLRSNSSGQRSLRQLVSALSGEAFDLTILQAAAAELLGDSGSKAKMEVKYQLLAAIARGCAELDHIDQLEGMSTLIRQLASRFPEWRELEQLGENCREHLAELQAAAQRRLQAESRYEAALEALRAHRLLPPEADNALDCVQQALALDPEHAGAKSLLGKLPDAVELMADRLHQAGNHTAALALVRNGLGAFPGHEELGDLQRMLEQELRMQALEREREARLLALVDAVSGGVAAALPDAILTLVELNDVARLAPTGQRLLSVIAQRLDRLATHGDINALDALGNALGSFSVMAEVAPLQSYPPRLQARWQHLQEAARIAAERAEAAAREAVRRKEAEAREAAERAQQAAAEARAQQLMADQLRSLATLPAALPHRAVSEFREGIAALPDAARRQLWAALDRDGFAASTLSALTDARLHPDALQEWLSVLESAGVSAVALLPLRKALQQRRETELTRHLSNLPAWLSASTEPAGMAQSISTALTACISSGLDSTPRARLYEALQAAATSTDLPALQRLLRLLKALQAELTATDQATLASVSSTLDQRIRTLEAAERSAQAERERQAAAQALQAALAELRRALPAGSLRVADWRAGLQRLAALLREPLPDGVVEAIDQLAAQLIADLSHADGAALAALAEIQSLWSGVPGSTARAASQRIEAALAKRKTALEQAAIDARRLAWLSSFLAKPDLDALRDPRLRGAATSWPVPAQQQFSDAIRALVSGLLAKDAIAAAEQVCEQLQFVGDLPGLDALQAELLRQLERARTALRLRQRREQWSQRLDQLRDRFNPADASGWRDVLQQLGDLSAHEDTDASAASSLLSDWIARAERKIAESGGADLENLARLESAWASLAQREIPGAMAAAERYQTALRDRRDALVAQTRQQRRREWIERFLRAPATAALNDLAHDPALTDSAPDWSRGDAQSIGTAVSRLLTPMLQAGELDAVQQALTHLQAAGPHPALSQSVNPLQASLAERRRAIEAERRKLAEATADHDRWRSSLPLHYQDSASAGTALNQLLGLANTLPPAQLADSLQAWLQRAAEWAERNPAQSLTYTANWLSTLATSPLAAIPTRQLALVHQTLERRQRAESRYEAALEAVRAHRLLPPEANNALDCVQQALALDPAHAGAKSLLGKLPNTVQLMAERLHQAGSLTEALALVRHGLSAFPGHEELGDLQRMLEQEQALERERNARLLALADAVSKGVAAALPDAIRTLVELNDVARLASAGQRLLSVITQHLDSLATHGDINALDALHNALGNLSVMAEMPPLQAYPPRLQARRQHLQEAARIAAERAEAAAREAARRKEAEARAAAALALQSALTELRRALPAGSLRVADWRAGLQRLAALLHEPLPDGVVEAIDQLATQLINDLSHADGAALSAIAEIQSLWNGLPGSTARAASQRIEAALAKRKTALEQATIDAHRLAWLKRFLATPEIDTLSDLGRDPRLRGSAARWPAPLQQQFGDSIRTLISGSLAKDAIAAAEQVCEQLRLVGDLPGLDALQFDLLQQVERARTALRLRQRREQWSQRLDQLRDRFDPANASGWRDVLQQLGDLSAHEGADASAASALLSSWITRAELKIAESGGADLENLARLESAWASLAQREIAGALAATERYQTALRARRDALAAQTRQAALEQRQRDYTAQDLALDRAPDPGQARAPVAALLALIRADTSPQASTWSKQLRHRLESRARQALAIGQLDQAQAWLQHLPSEWEADSTRALLEQLRAAVISREASRPGPLPNRDTASTIAPADADEATATRDRPLPAELQALIATPGSAQAPIPAVDVPGASAANPAAANPKPDSPNAQRPEPARPQTQSPPDPAVLDRSTSDAQPQWHTAKSAPKNRPSRLWMGAIAAGILAVGLSLWLLIPAKPDPVVIESQPATQLDAPSISTATKTAEPDHSPPQSLGTVVLQIAPWGRIVDVRNDSNGVMDLTGALSDRGDLRLPAGSYRVLIEDGWSSKQARLSVTVTEQETVRLQHQFGEIDPDQYAEQAGIAP